METDWSATTAPVVEIGQVLAGGWTVERRFSGEEGPETLLLRDPAGARALGILLPWGAAEPQLSEEVAADWGTSRRILRDEAVGRVLVDEIPDGPLLAERVESGRPPGPALVEEISRVVLQQHRQGRAHGLIAPHLIVLGEERVALAGWGLAQGEHAEQRARDQAALGSLTGMLGAAVAERESETAATGGAGTAGFEPDPGGLRAAVASENLPSLRQAIERWREEGGSETAQDYVKAADALHRIEQRVAAQLQAAEGLLQRGDPLGAVAACREVMRLGEEERAAPLMKQARKQARKMLDGRGPSPIRLGIYAAAAIAGLALVLYGGWLTFGGGSGSSEIVRQAQTVARLRGERAVVAWLLDLRTTGESTARSEELLAEHLGRLVTGEREKLLDLRRRAVSQGARPQEADVMTQQALARLEALGTDNFESPSLASQISRTLIRLDKAAAIYRAEERIDAAAALAAVDQLMRSDPAFAPAQEGGP